MLRIKRLSSFLLLAATFLLTYSTHAQVGIGTTTPDDDALLELNSNATLGHGGLLMPRVELVETDEPDPLQYHVQGMTVYNTADVNDVSEGFYYNDGYQWIRLASDSSTSSDEYWSLEGNAGTAPASDFLGTTDNQPLLIRTYNQNRFEITSANPATSINAGLLRAYNIGAFQRPTYGWKVSNTTGMFLANSGGSNPDLYGIGFTTTEGTAGKERFRIPFTDQVHAMAMGDEQNPFYTWGDQPDVGMYRFSRIVGGVAQGSNLGFSASGIERMRILNTGSVIVNAHPNYLSNNARFEVHIKGNSDIHRGIFVRGTMDGSTPNTADGIHVQTFGHGLVSRSLSSTKYGGIIENTDTNEEGTALVVSGGYSTVIGMSGSGLGATIRGREFGMLSASARASNGIGVVGIGNNLGAGASIPNTGIGVAGFSDSVGVYGAAATGVEGQGFYGIYGIGSDTGVMGVGEDGVFGITFEEEGVGGWFINNDSKGTALIAAGNDVPGAWVIENGSGIAGTGETIGTFGAADDSDGIGVMGVGNGFMDDYYPSSPIPTPADGAGVYGLGYRGVVGVSDRSYGRGVFALDDSPNNSGGWSLYGIGDAAVHSDFHVYSYGSKPGDIYGMGALYMTGDVNGAAKNFLIDHPLDPVNKYLKHTSIESNEVLNLYRGTETFDAEGMVIVQLPDYYEALNKNPSYQLTPIGAFMELYIAEEISNGRFVIAGGIPGKKVSWAVQAERDDPYIHYYPETTQMELDKGEDRGYYLRPELYGQPEEKGIQYKKMFIDKGEDSGSVSNNRQVIKRMSATQRVSEKDIPERAARTVKLQEVEPVDMDGGNSPSLEQNQPQGAVQPQQLQKSQTPTKE